MGLAAGVAPAAAGAVFPGVASGAAQDTAAKLIKPRRLKQGDVVGLNAPGGLVDDALVEKCVRNLESLGFSVKPGKNIRCVRGGYAGTVAQRLEDLHGMFRDREVAAIWAARGGSGCTGLLPRIDYALVRRNPKVLVGYSDITALHLGLLRHSGLVTFHGPVASSTFSDYSVGNLRSVLMEPRPSVTLPMAAENLAKAPLEPQFAPRTYRDGVAEGRLVGGNLSALCSMVGTPHAPFAKGGLLFLEEIGEAPYRIDRMLTQLRQSGLLSQAGGVMLGVFQKCTSPDDEPSLTLDEVFRDQLGDLGVPAAYGLSFGHIAHQLTLPVGVRARFDTQAGTLTLLEPAVLG
jgi:muramoyltetrapeptide carboxypeptidase